jgi:hypothetical protein
MYNSQIPETRHSIEPDTEKPIPSTVNGARQSGQRTIEGAVIMTIAPVPVVMAISYPTAAAVIVVAMSGVVATAKYVRGASSGGFIEQSESKNSDQVT